MNCLVLCGDVLERERSAGLAGLGSESGMRFRGSMVRWMQVCS